MRHQTSWLLCHGTRSIRSTANTSRSTRTRQKTNQEKCCYIRSFASSPDIEMEARLTDDVAVQTGEMVAIKMALDNVCQLEQTTTHRRYAIFTDSLSTIDNLVSSRSRSRPNLLSDMIDLGAYCTASTVRSLSSGYQVTLASRQRTSRSDSQHGQ